MIGISKLYCGTVDRPMHCATDATLPGCRRICCSFRPTRKPVVVWNVTRRCNLRCIHCYAHATKRPTPMSSPPVKARPCSMISLRSAFRWCSFPAASPWCARPAGTRRLCRRQGHARRHFHQRHPDHPGHGPHPERHRPVLRGISLDGMQEVTTASERSRRLPLGAGRHPQRQAAGIKVGLRFTINRFNVQEIPHIFDLIEEMDIPRVCFYHLVYAGRGSELVKEDLSSRTAARPSTSSSTTPVGCTRSANPKKCDGRQPCRRALHYLRMLQENPERAGEAMELLKWNEGNNSGRGIGCVSWDGAVHADQFWRHYSFGNVKERPFSEIWMDTSNPLMESSRKRKSM